MADLIPDVIMDLTVSATGEVVSVETLVTPVQINAVETPIFLYSTETIGPVGPGGPSAVSNTPGNVAAIGGDSLILVQGPVSGNAAPNQVVKGSDTRLSDIRSPASHAPTHKSGGPDAIKLDELAAPSDTTNLNASLISHGLLRKLDGVTAHVLQGDGTWGTPLGAGDMLKSDYDPTHRGYVDRAVLADSVPLSGVSGLPATFPPSPHAASHLTTDKIAAATATASGLVPTPPNDPNTFLSGVATFAPALPPGIVLPYGGSAAPAGFLLADGTSYPTATYPNLFAAIGYTFGGSAGNFNVPDMRGRTPVGAGQGTGLTNRARGGTTGEELHALAVGELAAHTHTQPDHYHTISGGGAHTHTATLGDHYHGIPASGNHSHSDAGHTHSISDPGHAHATGLKFHAVFGNGSATATDGGSGVNTSAAGTGIGIVTGYASLSASGNIGPTQTYWTSQVGGIPAITVASSGSITPNTTYESATMGAVGVISTVGSGTAHQNMQPSLFLSYIVKT